jgi:protein involved in polysaccharide export with SLBB domain
MPFRRFILLAVVLAALCATTLAQNTGNPFSPPLPQASQPSYYYVANPGEMTMQVNLWGDVQKPGRYEVPVNTDLIQLISLAGGPTREANLSEVQISRHLKASAGLTKQQVKVNLEDFFKTDEAKLALQPGDQIYVSFVTRLNIRDVFTVITTVALVTAAVAQVMYISKR